MRLDQAPNQLATPQDLEHRLFQLETLYEIGHECARVERLDDALRIVLSMVMGAFGSLGGRIDVRDAEGRVIAGYDRGAAPAQHAPQNGSAPEAVFTAPFDVDDTHHGSLTLGPRLSGEPYSAEECELLQTIAANAAVHLRRIALVTTLRATAGALERKVKALAVVNEIALGIASRPGAFRLHRFLCDKIAAALDAETEFADAAPEASTAADPASPHNESHHVLIPVRYGADLLGTLRLNRSPTAPPFDREDHSLLQLLANEVAVVLENSRLFESFLTQQQEQFRLRGVLEQYLAPSVAERLIAGQVGPPLKGARYPIAHLRVDMRKSTEFVRSVDVDTYVDFMNDYIGRIVDVLFKYEGTVDRLDGDGVIGFFGAPEAHDDDPLRAVRASLAMLRGFAEVRAHWATRRALPPKLGIGIGVVCGDTVVGNIGSTRHLHYTVSGLTVNLAARFVAKAPAGNILIDEHTWHTVQDPLDFPPALRARRPRRYFAKGFTSLVPAYRLCPTDLPHILD